MSFVSWLSKISFFQTSISSIFYYTDMVVKNQQRNKTFFQISVIFQKRFACRERSRSNKRRRGIDMQRTHI